LFKIQNKKYTWILTLFMIAAFSISACAVQPAAPNGVDKEADLDDEHADSDKEQTVEWGYEGAGGPENWGKLHPDYALCDSGLEQSPIDLTNPTEMDLENIVFEYSETNVNILNNGHTIQVNYDEGSSIEIDGQRYNLLQFHFHAPSEHTTDGNSYPLELHLVHSDDAGNLAVVGIFITEGEENEAFAPIWDHLPAEKTDGPIDTGTSFNADGLLPEEQTLYRYNGSLTTPPCSEGVLWSVMTQPVEMSAEQIAAFTDIFDNNNRPIQPLNERSLSISGTP